MPTNAVRFGVNLMPQTWVEQSIKVGQALMTHREFRWAGAPERARGAHPGTVSRTYSPGAGLSTGYRSLPSSPGGDFRSPARAVTQSAHASHQLPCCLSAPASHSSGSAPGGPPVQ